MIGTIYKVVLKSDRRAYVGQTWYTPEERMQKHLYDAEHGSRYKFHRALLKYGLEAFEIITLVKQECSQQELDQFEKLYVTLNESYGPRGFNLTPGGRGRGRGQKHTIEAKAKISAANIGLNVGRKHTAESRQNMSKAHLGQVAWNKGKKHTAEHCANMSKARKGKYVGRQHTAETKLKMSIAAKQREAKKRELHEKNK